MSRLFKRFIQLSLIKPKIEKVQTPLGFWAQQPNAVIVRTMRVRFKIEKNLGKHPNKASITITNLAPETIAALKKPLIVQLEVGYDGVENLQKLFSGDLRIADTMHNGPDVDTKLEMGEGDTAFQFGHISQAYASGSKVLSTVKDALGQLGLPVPPGLDAVAELQGVHAGGITLHGQAHRELSKLLTPVGMSWSMQEGKAVLLRDGQVRESQAVVISLKNGMVGSPQLGAGKKPGEAASLHVKTLIDPRIVAGCQISVDSRDVKGLFRVEHLEHSGDSRSKDWYTTIKARQL
jgi:hypothetical protein